MAESDSTVQLVSELWVEPQHGCPVPDVDMDTEFERVRTYKDWHTQVSAGFSCAMIGFKFDTYP